MAVFTSYPRHHFCWIDLMARDAAVTESFLCELFGWQAHKQDTQGGPPYIIFTQDGLNICGFGQMNREMVEAGTPSIWCSYIRVDSVDSTVDQVVSLGGKVMMPAIDVMDAGRMAILGDPEGAMFALWEPKNHCGSQLTNVPNTWSWNELASRDLPKAREFYGKLFGWEIKEDSASEMEYWNICNQGRLNGGMTTLPPGTPPQIPAYWCVYFAVADIHVSTERVKDLGGNLIYGPFTVEPGHIAVVSEPGGGVFCLIQLTTPPDDSPES